MLFTAEQKSQLAKLLATENLSVQHQKISTARFDPQNRILYLPIWQNMTGFIYDLLVGHEVGHALYTPADGWHDAVVDETKPKSYKGFLNVVEDARIEKKVKRKYPGLNSAFKLAYQELNNRDFFGIGNRDVNQMPFIDRLNLFSKSQWAATWIQFTAQEEVFIKQVQAAETWEEVLRITDAIFEYSKGEQQELKMMDFVDYYDDIDSSDEEGEEDFPSDVYDDEETDEETEDESNESKSFSEGEENEEDENSDDESDGQSINHDKFSQDSQGDLFNPSCETDDNYRRNEIKLVDDKCKEWVYVEIPKPILKNIVTPIDRVQSQLTSFYDNCVTEKQISPLLATKLLSEFKNKNERYISLLAKEFEMRKAAKSFSKSKLSDTGDIDINKLATYKFDDNIFRKVLMVPKGKSHGLVLLLDKSGSMRRNMPGSIEQIIVLTMFCRKVNIPFVVYGFGNSNDVHILDRGYKHYTESCFEQNVGCMDFASVRLREYLNSNMTNVEFTKAIKNLMLVKKSFEGGYHSEIPMAPTESLSNTPLTQAIVATSEIMKDFKKKYNLDMTSLVIVHDGDADWLNNYYYEKEFSIHNQVVKKLYTNSFEFYHKNYIIRDRSNKYEAKLEGEQEYLNQNILDWFRKTTGSKVFGFFIIEGGRGNLKQNLRNRYFAADGSSYNSWQRQDHFNAEEKLKGLLKQFKTEKFLESKTPGFNSFFFISGGNELQTEEDEIEIEGKVTTKKLATAFAKFNKKKAVNRVLVSKFIQGIAA